jgi:hypothetical protein
MMIVSSPFYLLQVNLFVAKLHGPTIGLSVLGIITITKEMLLTVSLNWNVNDK